MLGYRCRGRGEGMDKGRDRCRCRDRIMGRCKGRNRGRNRGRGRGKSRGSGRGKGARAVPVIKQCTVACLEFSTAGAGENAEAWAGAKTLTSE